MKVLIFKAYFEPETAASLYLTNNLIQDLANSGNEVELHVPTPTRGVSDSERKEYKRRKYEELFNGKVKVHRFNLFKEHQSSILRALRYLLSNGIYLYKGIKSKNVDVIHVGSTPPTMGIVAVLLKKIKKKPVVYTLQDIFPDSMVSTGHTKENSILWKIGRIIEDYTYKNVDKLIVISEDFKKNIMLKGVPENKIEVIYNWVDENAIVPIDRDKNVLFDNLKLEKDNFYVVYAGNLGHAQNIEVLLRVAGKMNDNSDVTFLIFGGGNQEREYKEMAKKMKLSNTLFYPLQPYSLVSEVYSLGNVSIVSCKEGLGKSAMPSKTWSIMSSGTAIVANFDANTDLQNIIETNNVGIFTAAGDVNALEEAIITLYENKILCKKMGENGREFIENNLTRTIGTNKYISVMKNIGGVQ